MVAMACTWIADVRHISRCESNQQSRVCYRSTGHRSQAVAQMVETTHGIALTGKSTI